MIPIQPQDSASGAQAAVQRDIQHYMRPGTLQLGSLPPLSLYVHCLLYTSPSPRD